MIIFSPKNIFDLFEFVLFLFLEQGTLFRNMLRGYVVLKHSASFSKSVTC